MPAHPRRSSVRRLFVAGVLGLAMLGITPWTVAAADGSPEPSPTAEPTPTPTAEPTSTPAPTPTPTPTPAPNADADRVARPHVGEPLPLERHGPPVHELLVRPGRDPVDGQPGHRHEQSQVSTQKYYYKKTRLNNRYRYRTLGNDPQGWAWALRYFSRGTTTYQARAYSDKNAAIAAIADSIARTRDPVGVTVRGGTHAWVVLGYRASAPASDPTRRTVLGFYVSGPLGSPPTRGRTAT